MREATGSYSRRRVLAPDLVVSLAAALAIHRGVVADVRLAVGGVAPKPWRASAAEDALRGAVPREHNGFTAELVRRTLAATLVGGGR